MPTYAIVVTSMYTIEAKNAAEAEHEALGDARNADDSEIVSCQKI